jgi:phage gp46-like protein
MHIDPCLDQNIGRRRIFWTTRLEACGTDNVCGVECALPGLIYKDDDTAVVGGRTIDNDKWLEGLVLNILNTRARSDLNCPSPAGMYGHWSESYRDDNLYIGATMWNAAEKPYIRTGDGARAIGVAVQSDVGKLMALGVARSVEVEVKPLSWNTVSVKISITTAAGVSHINLSGSFVSETWVWH